MLLTCFCLLFVVFFFFFPFSVLLESSLPCCCAVAAADVSLLFRYFRVEPTILASVQLILRVAMGIMRLFTADRWLLFFCVIFFLCWLHL